MNPNPFLIRHCSISRSNFSCNFSPCTGSTKKLCIPFITTRQEPIAAKPSRIDRRTLPAPETSPMTLILIQYSQLDRLFIEIMQLFDRSKPKLIVLRQHTMKPCRSRTLRTDNDKVWSNLLHFLFRIGHQSKLFYQLQKNSSARLDSIAQSKPSLEFKRRQLYNKTLPDAEVSPPTLIQTN